MNSFLTRRKNLFLSMRKPNFFYFLFLFPLFAEIPLIVFLSEHKTSSQQYAAGEYFSTLPPGSALPSDAECAARVRRNPWEPRPQNFIANHNVITGYTFLPSTDPSFVYVSRVTGNFTGTTDEIIQWASCKWGIDEDTVRAQAVNESNWVQSSLGDCNRAPTQLQTNNCQSVGLLQIKAADIPATIPGAWPYALNSTAFNVDLELAIKRACYDGKITWLHDKNPSYAAGDLWGCIGESFSGGWYDQGAIDYITKIKNYYNTKPWIAWGYPRLSSSTPARLSHSSTPPSNNPSYSIYMDSLAAGWVNWSWSSAINFANPSPAHNEKYSIAFLANAGRAALNLHTGTPVDTTPYRYLHFAAQAQRSNQHYIVILYDSKGNALSGTPLSNLGGDPVAGQWKEYTIPLATINAAGKQVSGIALENYTDNTNQLLYVDAISLMATP